MTDPAMTRPLSTSGASAAASSADVTNRNRRRPSAKLLLNVGGWLLFCVAMVIGWLDVMPWSVILATQPVYVIIG
ncbi:MAG TPA: hypothetical protein VM939_14925, partial [Gemmatimonadaceae bacterium]|nr:hypothetical protein [Gemmatimonadaceae bacterium]